MLRPGGGYSDEQARIAGCSGKSIRSVACELLNDRGGTIDVINEVLVLITTAIKATATAGMHRLTGALDEHVATRDQAFDWRVAWCGARINFSGIADLLPSGQPLIHTMLNIDFFSRSRAVVGVDRHDGIPRIQIGSNLNHSREGQIRLHWWFVPGRDSFDLQRRCGLHLLLLSFGSFDHRQVFTHANQTGRVEDHNDRT